MRTLSWTGFAAFLAFAAALSAWTWSGILLVNKPMELAEHVGYFLMLLQRNLLTYFPIYILVSLADGLPLTGVQRRIALSGALVLAVALAVQVRCAVSTDQMFWVYGAKQLPFCTALPTWRTYVDFPGSWITPLALGAMVMVFAFGRRRDSELAEALHRARTAQVEAHRSRIESDLEAMQARVDPNALFERLRAIRARYDDDPASGEAMLDELIAGLRAAARAPAGGAA